jgi:hypothetical protein
VADVVGRGRGQRGHRMENGIGGLDGPEWPRWQKGDGMRKQGKGSGTHEPPPASRSSPVPCFIFSLLCTVDQLAFSHPYFSTQVFRGRKPEGLGHSHHCHQVSHKSVIDHSSRQRGHEMFAKKVDVRALYPSSILEIVRFFRNLML